MSGGWSNRCYQAAVTLHREPEPEDAAGGSQQNAGMAGRKCTGRLALLYDWRALHSPAATCSNKGSGRRVEPIIPGTNSCRADGMADPDQTSESLPPPSTPSLCIHPLLWPVLYQQKMR